MRRMSDPGRRPLREGRASLALAVVLMAGGCGPSSEPDLAPLRVGFTRHLTMSPLLIAEAEGFFEEEGLDVELVAIESAAVGIPSLLQGRLDVLPGPVSTAFFNAIHRGGRLRIISDKGRYDIDDCSHNALVFSTAATAGEDPPTIERISTANEHFLQFFIERALLSSGYDPDSIEMVHAPQAAEYDALIAGRLDAAFVGEPWLTRIRDNGGRVVMPTNVLFDGYQYSVIAFGPSLLDRNPELGERFAIALLRALRRYNEGKTERNLDVLSEVMRLDREELVDVCWPTMGTDGLIDLESIMDFQGWAVDRGDQDAIVPPERFWDPRFVEHAARILDERAR